MAQKWQFHEEYWSEDYPWFIVDNGSIIYAFQTEAEANEWLQSQYIDYMLVAHLDEVANKITLDPADTRSWEGGKKECLELLWLNRMKPQ